MATTDYIPTTSTVDITSDHSTYYTSATTYASVEDWSDTVKTSLVNYLGLAWTINVSDSMVRTIQYANQRNFSNNSGTTCAIYPYGYDVALNGTNTVSYDWGVGTDWTSISCYKYEPPSEKELFRSKIRNNLVVAVKSRANLIQEVKQNEARAIETLREEISESEFRKYVKYGFILVKGKSGKTYQVFRNRSHTQVWLGGKLIEEVCIRIRDSVPATDNVIAFKAMIEADEEEFRKLGNLYKNLNRAAA